MKRNKDKTPIICRCNNVSRGTLETAIREGCDTMNKIFDATTAGVGPCGGSCRRKILPMLEQYLKTGTFPEKIVEDTTGKVLAKPAISTEPSAPTAPTPNPLTAASSDANAANGSNNAIDSTVVGDGIPEGTKKPNSSDENR